MTEETDPNITDRNIYAERLQDVAKGIFEAAKEGEPPIAFPAAAGRPSAVCAGSAAKAIATAIIDGGKVKLVDVAIALDYIAGMLEE